MYNAGVCYGSDMRVGGENRAWAKRWGKSRLSVPVCRLKGLCYMLVSGVEVENLALCMLSRNGFRRHKF